MDWLDLGFSAIDFLYPALLALLGWVAQKLRKFIDAKAMHEYVKGILLRLNDAVWAAVRDVQQTFVDKIKEGRADGKLTEDEIALAKAMAISKIKSYLGLKGAGVLMKVLGLDGKAFEEFLGSKVEAAVADGKAGKL